MVLSETDSLSKQEKNEILLLWNSEYPKNLQYNHIEELQNYLDKVTDHHHILLKDEDERLKGWYFDFIRENKRWFATILHHNLQGKGYGTRLLDLAKRRRKELHGWVIIEDCKKMNGDPYRSPADFYRKNNFIIRENEKLISKNFSAIKVEWYDEKHIEATSSAGLEN